MALSQYRSVGGDRDDYPTWLTALRSKSGVYAIRSGQTGKVLYVGSSKRDLYATITRHLQSWRRLKGFWKGLHGAHHDPGLTYKRATVEVAYEITTASDHLHAERRLIARLSPRDNIVSNPDGDVPW